MPAEHPGPHAVIHRQRVIGIVVAIDHQMPRPRQKLMTIAAQMAQHDPLALGLIAPGHRLDRLQRRLVHHPARIEIDDHHLRIALVIEELDKPIG